MKLGLVAAAAIFCLLFVFLDASEARADAFIPTMLTANVLWILILPVVIGIEGWFMARQKWPKPYGASFIANILSMLAVLPVEVGFSAIGAAMPKTGIGSFFAGMLTYGWVPVPSYGYTVDFNQDSAMLLASILFIGLCWLFSIAIEALFYRRRFRALIGSQIEKRDIWRVTIKSHSVSYALILALWLPYSFYSAYMVQEEAKKSCALPNESSKICAKIFEKFPEVKEKREQAP